MAKRYLWEFRIQIPPYDKLMDVLEAFFASYPGGDYTCERRERYRLEFRRGLWKKSLLGLGQLVPDRLVKGRFSQWPTIVQVLARPSPGTYAITIRYEVHLPRSVPALATSVQRSVGQHARKELEDLAHYLADCAGLDEKPEVTAL